VGVRREQSHAHTVQVRECYPHDLTLI